MDHGAATAQGQRRLKRDDAMTESAPTVSLPFPTQAAPLSLLAAGGAMCFGITSLSLGILQSSPAFAGFGVACLFQIPLALSLFFRIRAGLGNRGLERELRTLRWVSHGLRLLALGLAVLAAFALLERQFPDPGLAGPALAALAAGLLAWLWVSKRTLSEFHPSLALDAARARTLLELAAILLAWTLIGRAFPGADAVTALALALRLWVEGRSLAALSAFKAACGGGGTGCGC